jgi:hypothetical protein
MKLGCWSADMALSIRFVFSYKYRHCRFKVRSYESALTLLALNITSKDQMHKRLSMIYFTINSVITIACIEDELSHAWQKKAGNLQKAACPVYCFRFR